AATRGLSAFEGLAPRMNVALARSAGDAQEPLPKDWNSLSLYLNLEEIDPNLRGAIAGKKAGDKFGPFLLRNGARIEGQIDELLPNADLSRTTDFWKLAAMRAR